MNDRDVVDQARAFWKRADVDQSFPRNIESAVVWSLPLAVLRVPNLTTNAVCAWLSARGLPRLFVGPDRRIRACVVARCGRGIVFVDSLDPADEQRFSLAHEIAHFIRDYLMTRQKIIASMPWAVDILDGVRPASPRERLVGILKGVPVGAFTHLMDRSAVGGVASLSILDAEDEADALALELVAPRSAVLARMRTAHVDCRGADAGERVARILRSDFGLPHSVAQSYGGHLVMEARPHRSVRTWLGLVGEPTCRTSGSRPEQGGREVDRGTTPTRDDEHGNR